MAGDPTNALKLVLAFTVPDLGSHSTFLAANFPTTLSGLFGSHSATPAVIKMG